jgi:hypothetical protein
MKRPLAAFLGIWFLLVMIEPDSIHSCPVHSAAAAGHSAHAGHHAAAPGHHKSSNTSAALCSCPGDCASSAFSALPSGSSALVEQRIVAVADGALLERRFRLEQPDFFLPFAIGPPAPMTA